MSYPVLTLAEHKVDGAHERFVFTLSDPANMVAESAKAYRDLRTETRLPLTPVVWEGITIADEATLRANLCAALVAPSRRNDVFDVIRSDLGEVLMYFVLENHFGGLVGHKAVRFRERRDMPARGLDAVALTREGRLGIYIGEAKVSVEEKSPPSVVQRSDDSLWNQHTAHFVRDFDETVDLLWGIYAATSEADFRDRLGAAIMLLRGGRFVDVDLIAVSVLVRPNGTHQEKDFAIFAAGSDALKPAVSRFAVIAFDEDLELLLQEFHAQARSQPSDLA